jgi:steroid delta-isomerase-like uncharacterized protein
VSAEDTAAAAEAGAGAVEAEARERLMRAYLDAWNSHDPDAVAAFFAPNALYEDTGAGERPQGREAIRAHVATVMAAFPDLRFELVRAAHGPAFTAGEWRSEMTHLGPISGLAPSGRVVRSAGVDVATLDGDDLIAHLASYYDGAAILRDLGVLPERHSRGERVRAGLVSLPRRARALGRRG